MKVPRRARTARPCETTVAPTAILMPPRRQTRQAPPKTLPAASPPSPGPRTPSPPSDFAAGFVSVQETPTPTLLQVHGRLPSYIQGNLYRIGPGVFDLKHSDGTPAEKTHWFDGIGVVFKFSLDARRNTISFMSRIVCPEAVRAIESTPAASYKETSFGATRRCSASRLSKLRHLLRPPTRDPSSGQVPVNLNVSLEGLPGVGPLVARADCSTAVSLDPETLRPTSRFAFSDLHPSLRGPGAAAHSAHDAATGETFNFVAGDWRDLRRYRVFRIAKDGRASVLADVRGPPACHVHSVALTPRFVVLAVSPWRVDVAGMLTDGALAPHLNFDAEEPTRFFVVSREHGRLVGEFECDAFASFHHVNAFEETDGTAVHVDVCRYERPDVIEQFYLRNLRQRPADWFAPVVPVRYSLRGLATTADAPVARGEADARALCAHRLELPCVAPAVEGRAYRFAYGVSHDATHDDMLANTLVKVDMATGERRAWQAERCSVGEPTFIPDPDDGAEDAGSLVSVVVDARRGTSFLVVLDARTMEEVCRADTPETVPHAFHGLYLGEDELE